jgi:hypothetical protein
MNDAAEFSQMCLGEQIITGREITQDEFTEMNEKLNEYGDGTYYQPESGSPWMGDKMIYRVEYQKDNE